VYAEPSQSVVKRIKWLKAMRETKRRFGFGMTHLLAPPKFLKLGKILQIILFLLIIDGF
jgi:hypothetical protein